MTTSQPTVDFSALRQQAVKLGLDLTQYETIPADCHLVLTVPGVTAAEIQRGIEAAQRIFEVSGVHPYTAYIANSVMEREWTYIRENPDPIVSIEAWELVGAWAEVWNDAEGAALEVACAGGGSVTVKFSFYVALAPSEPAIQKSYWPTSEPKPVFHAYSAWFNHTRNEKDQWD